MTEKNLPRRDPIVARRADDLGEPRQTNYRDAGRGVEGLKRNNILMLVLVLILAACLAGTAWFSWQQSRAQALLQYRFDDLAAKIESTDESLSQSGAALSVRLVDQQKELAKHWSEIKKLWGVSNDRNKKAIAALELADTKSAKKRIELTKNISSLSTQLNAEQKQLKIMIGELGSDSLASVAKIDEIGERVDQLSGSQQKLNLSIDQKRRALENRLKSVEKAIESIDSFRRQTNQTLDALRQVPSVQSIP
jgi:chromosome segregation ATPase